MISLSNFFSSVSFLMYLALMMETRVLSMVFKMTFCTKIGSLSCSRSMTVTTSGWK